MEDSSLTLDGHPTTMSFIGVRKVARVINPLDEPAQKAPLHGSEVAFSKFVVASAADLEVLVRGESFQVIYEE